MKRMIFAMMVTLTMAFSPANAEGKDFKNTFAVVWNTTTDDKELMKNTLADQASATLALWKQGVIENVYMNTDAEPAAEEKSTTITFFIKAETRIGAAEVLNELPFVKKKIAEYQLFPVGFLWLKTFDEQSAETEEK